MLKSYLNSIFPHTKFIFSILLLLVSGLSFAQNNSVAIGSPDVKDNAVLWLNGDGGQGLLLPTVAAVGDIASPDAGMIVYQTSDNKVYYRNASAWLEIGAGGSGSSDSYSLEINTNSIQLLKNGSAEGAAISLDAVEIGASTGDIGGTIANPQIKAGAVGLTALASMGATNGDILEYNGSTWTVVANSGGTTYTAGTGIDVTGTVITNTGDTDASDDLTNTSSVNDLADVNITSPSNTQILQYQSGQWVNVPLPAGTGDLVSTNNLGDVANAGTARTNLGLGTLATGTGTVSTDGTLVGNSNANIPTEQAVKTYVDTELGALPVGGDLVSTNNLSDVANAGTARTNLGLGTLATGTGTVSTDGTLVGNSNANIPTEQAVKTYVDTELGALPVGGDLVSTNNLSDVTNAATARTNLGLGTLATGTGTVSTDGTLVGNSNANIPTEQAVKTYVDTEIGAIPAGGDLVSTNNLSDVTNAATARTNLGLGTIATQAASSVAVTGGTVGNVAITNSTINNSVTGDGSGLTNINATVSGGVGGTITDGTITTVDIAATTITDANISNTAALNPQKLDFTGTSDGDILQITGGVPVWSAAGGGNDAQSLQGTDIDPAISGATDGQVLKWNNVNTRWELGSDDVGGGGAPTLSDGQVMVGDGASNSAAGVTGDLTMSGAADFQIAPDAVTTTEIGTAGLGDADKVLTTDGSGDPQWELKSSLGAGDMLGSNNLSDVADAPTARTNLGLGGLAILSTVSTAQVTDITSVGSGDIITGAERGQIGTNQTNIGINTTSITANTTAIAADLDGDATNEIQNAAGVAFDDTGAVLGATDVQGAIDALDAAVDGFTGVTDLQGAYDGGNDIQLDGTNEFTINSSATNPLIVTDDANERIGIGTSSPAFTLDVEGDINTLDSYYLGAAEFISRTGSSVFLGVNAGHTNSNNFSTHIGHDAGALSTSPSNTFLGFRAGSPNTSGSENVFIGRDAGGTNTTGNQNTIIGRGANVGSPALTNATAIGYNAIVSASNTMRLGQDNTAIEFNGALTPNANAGTSGQILTSAGPGAVPTWSNAGAAATLQSAYDGDSDIVLTDGTTPIRITATSGASDFEQLLSLGVSDDTGGLFIENSTNTDAQFVPSFRANTSGNSSWTFRMNAADNPPTYFDFQASQSGGLVGDFDGLMTITNNGGSRFTFTGAGQLSIRPTSATAISLHPYGTGVGNTAQLEFRELAAGGNNVVGFKAPDALATDVIMTLPVDNSSGVLTNDGAGVLSWGAAGAAATLQSAYDVGNTIQLAANDNISFTKDDTSDLLYLDESTGGVGIGTSTFGAGIALQVANGGLDLDINQSYKIGGEIVLRRIAAEVQVGSNLVTPLAFLAGSEAGRFTTSGRLGIGTSSPHRRLHIDNSAQTFEYMQITNSTTGNTNTDGLLVGMNGDVAQITNLQANNLEFGTNGNPRMYIDAIGGVGIGGVPGAYSLDVSGESNFQDAIYMGGDFGTSGDLLVSDAGGGPPNWTSPASLGFATSLEGAYNGSGAVQMTAANGDIDIRTQTTGQLAFFIEEATGEVGIGTNNPTGRLEVDGLNGDGALQITDTDVRIGDYEGTQFGTYLYIDPEVAGNFQFLNGDVGIGTTTPNFQLNPEGTTGAELYLSRNDVTTLNGNFLGKIAFGGNDGGEETTITNAAGLIAVRASGPWSAAARGSEMVFHTKATSDGVGAASTERMRIDSDGRIGVGNTNPNALLSLGDLYTTPVGDISVYMSDDGGDAFFETGSGDMSEGLVMHGSGTGESGIVRNLFSSGFMTGKPTGLHIFNDLTEPIIFSTTDTERMRIEGSGSVGIGTNVPENTLHIQDLVNSPILKIEGPNNGVGIDPALRFTEQFGTDYGFDLYLDADQNALKIRSIEIDATVVDNILNIERSTGYIGMGTDNPAVQMEIFSTTANALRVSGTGGAFASGALELNGTGTSDWRVKPLLGQLYFSVGDVEGGSMTDQIFMGDGTLLSEFSSVNGFTLGSTTNRWNRLFAVISTSISSDRRLKKNIKNLNYGLSDLLKVRPVSYQLKANENNEEFFGVIAQEMQQVMPELVAIDDNEEKTLSMSYTELIPVTIKAIQEQQSIIEGQEDQIAELNKRIATLEAENMSFKKADLNENQLKAMKSEIMEEVKAMLGAEAKKAKE